jgi:hypothetical protein
MNKKQEQMIKKVENKKDQNETVWSCIAKSCKIAYDSNSYGMIMSGAKHFGKKLELRKPSKVFTTIYNMLHDDNASEEQIIDILKVNVKEIA